MRHVGVVPRFALLAVVGALACSPDTHQTADPVFLEAEREWRQRRAERLQAQDGWLTLVGLHWLEEGTSTFGAAPSCDIRLRGGELPDLAGSLVVDEALHVRLQPAPGVSLTVNGEPAEPRRLSSDADGDPDIVGLGRLALYVIRRADRVGLRIKDPQARTRADFPGLTWYPPDPDWRIEACLERFPEPRPMRLPSAAVGEQEALVPGTLAFDIDGDRYELIPTVSAPDSNHLFVVFGDATNGRETYGAGRFLSAEVGPDDRVVLNFNRAYSPPCAFTPYATCPLPPPENLLPVAVRAGEKLPPGDH